MFNLIKKKIDLNQLKDFTKQLAEKVKIGDVYLLQGELGAGKTTFARYFISSIFQKNFFNKPESIKSPSFPIMINYPLSDYEILHYDFYRLKNINELIELNFYENISDNITIVEWPEIIIKRKKIKKFFLINLKIINTKKREIEIMSTHIKEF